MKQIFLTPIQTLALFSSFNCLLAAAAVILSSNLSYLFLIWNLFLAWVPFLIAFVWFKRLEFKKPLAKWKSFLLGLIWLLFFPNAPYMITDLIHLSGRFNPPLWSDIILFFGMAMNAIILGVYSLFFIHRALNHYTNPIISWIVVITSIVACGFGVYLGRVERWNSWDLMTNPYLLVKNALFSLSDPFAVKMALGFSSLTFMIYLVLKTIIHYESDQRNF